MSRKRAFSLPQPQSSNNNSSLSISLAKKKLHENAQKLSNEEEVYSNFQTNNELEYNSNYSNNTTFQEDIQKTPSLSNSPLPKSPSSRSNSPSPSIISTHSSQSARRHSTPVTSTIETGSQSRYRKKVELDSETSTERRKQRILAIQNQSESINGNHVSLNNATKKNTRMLHGEDSNSISNENNVGVIIQEESKNLDTSEIKAIEERQLLIQDISQWMTKIQNTSLKSTDASETDSISENVPLTDYHPDIFSHRAELTPIKTDFVRKSSIIMTDESRNTYLTQSIPGSIPTTPVDWIQNTPMTPENVQRSRRNSIATEILKPTVMTLSHGDDFDENDTTNMIVKSMKNAWNSINSFEAILNNEILSNVTDLSDLIDDFMATNLLNLSLKLRNLCYKIEEVDDINARRTHDERKFILNLLDIADEEEKFRARKFLSEHPNLDEPGNENTIPPMTPEDVAQRSLRRKIRRERSVWNKIDKEAKERENTKFDKEIMTNVDASFIDHLQKEIVTLQRENIKRIHMMEDLCARAQIETKKAIIATRTEYEELERAEKNEREFGVQCAMDIIPTEKIVIKETDNSLKSFTQNLEEMFNSLSMDDVPPQMKDQIKTLMRLLINENQIQKELKDVEKRSTKSSKRIRDEIKKTSTSSTTPNVYSIEKIGALSNTDVNISRKVRNDLPPSLPNEIEEAPQQPIEVEKKTPPKRKPSIPKHQKSVDILEQTRSTEPPQIQTPIVKIKTSDVKAFHISDTPEKWAKRREEIIRRRYENMKKILKCFCTIVFVGNMNGFFKSLWDDDDEPMFSIAKSTKSSHHFYPEYTGRSGFEKLMNNTLKIPKPYDTPSSNELLPHLDEYYHSSKTKDTPSTSQLSTSRKIRASFSQGSKRNSSPLSVYSIGSPIVASANQMNNTFVNTANSSAVISSSTIYSNPVPPPRNLSGNSSFSNSSHHTLGPLENSSYQSHRLTRVNR